MQLSNNNIRIKTVVVFLTTNFFFELETVSLLKSGYYKCRDSICCRNNGQTIIAALFRLLGLYLELSTNTAILRKILQDDICKICRLYCRNIIVQIYYLENIVCLYIKFNVTERRKISKFFYNIL